MHYWLDAACLSSTLWESEAISQSLRAISAHRLIWVRPINAEKLKAVSHREHMLLELPQWSRISCLSKVRQQADVAEVAIITIHYDVRDAENAAESRNAVI